MSQQSGIIKMRRWSWAGFSLLVAIAGCSQSPSSPTVDSPGDEAVELPQVVVTTSVLCDLTAQIAQDTVDLTCLLDPGQDPHTYQSKPSDRQAIDEADLVLYDGYNSAPSMIGLVESSNNPAPKVAVYEAAVPNPLMVAGHDHDHAEGDDHDHAEGDDHDHAGGDDHEEAAELVADPHIWHSARNNGAIATVIADNLAQVNPDQAALYEENATQLTQQFTDLDIWIADQIATVPAMNRKLVTTHDSFRYFADAYDFEVKGALGGLSTEERPTAKTLTDLVDQVAAAQVPAIFAETTTNPELIEAIANDANVKVAEQPLFVEGPGGAGSKAPTIQAMLVTNTCTIVNALGGNCAEAEAPL